LGCGVHPLPVSISTMSESSSSPVDLPIPDVFLSIRCILADIRAWYTLSLSIRCLLADIPLWVRDSSTSSCRVSPPPVSPRTTSSNLRSVFARISVIASLVFERISECRSLKSQTRLQISESDSSPPPVDLPSECGTYKTVQARFWPWL